MPTKFMKLGFDEKVLRALANDTDGYVLDVGFNYYRGTPISAVERLELTVDGERVDDDRMLELLVPWAGHRQRVVRLIEAAGIGYERHGPRMTIADNRHR